MLQSIKHDEELSEVGIGNGHVNNTFETMEIPLEINSNTISKGKLVPAVTVSNANKSYGSGKTRLPVLYNLNMTVGQRTLYSLLGSSGCGKTSLLQCIVGIKHLDSGQIKIFGSRPSAKLSSDKIGYMPQDIALYNDFSIEEMITYFANLYRMSSREIQSSRDFLHNLLSLPDESRRIHMLSGGQKRRVSLAVALVHAPPLIILDEPTVGTDPLLRQTIWNYLRKLVTDGKASVIITTHHVDEASCCDQVGVMRGGRLLTEQSPKALYDKYNINSLQEVVLKLCDDDEKNPDPCGKKRSKSSGNILSVRRVSIATSQNQKYSVSEDDDWIPNESCFTPSDIRNSFLRIKSLTRKNLSVMLRNISLVLFVILMPAIQTIIMGMSMGSDPSPIYIGVVNHEMNGTEGCKPKIIETGLCDVANLSCRFLDHLPSNIFILRDYEREEEARDAIKEAKIRAFMKIPQGYSDYMYERSTTGVLSENETLFGSSIIFEMDASNTVITKSVQRILYESYQKFVKTLLSNCGFNPGFGDHPLKFENPIYGDYDMTIQEFVAAGMLVGVALFFPLCSSAITYIWDKKQGTMERARVAGTSTWEIMTSYFITEGFILILQTCICFFTVTYVFNIQIKSLESIILGFILIALNGFAGISLGLLIASICSEEIQAILLALAIMMPNFYLAGAMWPTESLPIVLQYLSLGLPGNLACEAFRSIIVRGWGLSHLHVWAGFVSTFAWICFYFVCTIYVHKVTLARK